MLWILLPLIIMAVAVILIFYYFCGFLKNCKKVYSGQTKGYLLYLLFFLLVFGISFSVSILIDFVMWADILASPEYLWRRVVSPSLIESLISGISAMLGVKVFKWINL